VTAGDVVSILALGSSDTASDSSASAAGAPGDGSEGAPSGGIDGLVSQQRSFGNDTSTSNGGTGSGTSGGGSASSSDGSVSVAAAVSINIAFTRSEAWIQDGRAISAGGAVTIKSSANTDAAAGADGTAVASGSDGVGVGAAIAINYVELTNSSTVGNTTITSNGLDIEAVMTSVPTAGGRHRGHDRFDVQTVRRDRRVADGRAVGQLDVVDRDRGADPDTVAPARHRCAVRARGGVRVRGRLDRHCATGADRSAVLDPGLGPRERDVDRDRGSDAHRSVRRGGRATAARAAPGAAVA